MAAEQLSMVDKGGEAPDGASGDGHTKAGSTHRCIPRRSTAIVCSVSLIGGILCILIPLIMLPTGVVETLTLHAYVPVTAVEEILAEFQVRTCPRGDNERDRRAGHLGDAFKTPHGTLNETRPGARAPTGAPVSGTWHPMRPLRAASTLPPVPLRAIAPLATSLAKWWRTSARS